MPSLESTAARQTRIEARKRHKPTLACSGSHRARAIATGFGRRPDVAVAQVASRDRGYLFSGHFCRLSATSIRSADVRAERTNAKRIRSDALATSQRVMWS